MNKGLREVYLVGVKIIKVCIKKTNKINIKVLLKKSNKINYKKLLK